MRNFFLSLGLAACTIILSAQQTDAPDYNALQKAISDSKSDLFYPSLYQRFVEGDTTLTLSDFRALYYGFSLREDFVPYQEEDANLLQARKRLLQEELSEESCTAAIEVAQKALLNNPFDLISLSMLPICYLQLGDSTQYRNWDYKLHGILDAIQSSGDGETAETAYHVINIQHEYEIFNRLGLDLEQVEVVNPQTDFIRAKTNQENIKGVYFNFGACSNIYREKYK
jgi:hypothetical protein